MPKITQPGFYIVQVNTGIGVQYACWQLQAGDDPSAHPNYVAVMSVTPGADAPSAWSTFNAALTAGTLPVVP